MPLEEQTYREGVKSDLQEIKDSQKELRGMLAFTNGKLRKVIVAMLLLGGIVIGLVSKNAADVVHLFTGVIH